MTTQNRKTMTAIEMAQAVKWVEVCVHFSWHGFVTVEGRVRVVRRRSGDPDSIWVDKLCLHPDGLMEVDIDAAKAEIFEHGERPRSIIGEATP